MWKEVATVLTDQKRFQEAAKVQRRIGSNSSAPLAIP
jgi:hypothetical protein